MVLSNKRRSGHKAGTTLGTPSPNFRYVCERAWRLGHGTICGLHVRAGDPFCPTTYCRPHGSL